MSRLRLPVLAGLLAFLPQTREARETPAVNDQSASRIVYALLVAAAMASAFFFAAGRLHHDPSLILVATRRWLQGAVLYRDIIEINPPLIFYLSAPSVLLSEILGVPDAVVFVWLICALTAVSLAWCWSFLHRVHALSLPRRLFVVVGCFLGLLVTPAYNFGQREHIFVILALPYFLAVAFAPMGLTLSRGEKLALGLCAVFGVALKPFFLLPLAGAAALRCWQEQSTRPLRDPANLAIAAGSVAYVALVLVAHPDYVRTVLPAGLKVYGAVGDNMVDAPWRLIYPPLLMLATATLANQAGRVSDTLTALSAVLFGLWVDFLAQHKIWDYLILPFDSMAVIASGVAIALTWQRMPTRPAAFLVLAAIPALLIASSLRDGRYDNVYAGPLGAKLKEVGGAGRSVLVLTTDVSAAFPLINETKARWVGSFPYQWMIAGALSRERQMGCAGAGSGCADLAAIRDFARQRNVDDVVRRAPDIVLIDVRKTKSYIPGAGLDYVDDFERDVRFETAWKHYRKIDTILDYEVWLRDLAAAPNDEFRSLVTTCCFSTCGSGTSLQPGNQTLRNDVREALLQAEATQVDTSMRASRLGRATSGRQGRIPDHWLWSQLSVFLRRPVL